jgi:leucyl-tRNA synthetase
MTTTTTRDPATTRRERYNHRQIEKKWQDAWAEARLYRFEPEPSRPKWYALTMYPYPSGDLHIGHWYAEAPPDAAARYKRMQGYSVLFPMGFDAFGLPAENAAIRRGIHPYIWTKSSIEKMREQFRTMGTMIDWSREVVTCDPEYYKWNQWFFLQFLKRGLAYRKLAPVWWCPSCQTVLANEQVVEGRCERCGAVVYQRDMEQWFLRITAYADELLEYPGIEWPERVRVMQRNWIGRSEGAAVTFQTEAGDPIEVFTTRPDTLWGATFMVLAPEHPLVDRLTTDTQRERVTAYQEQARRETEIERQATDKQKTGVFTGGYAINPVNNERIPVWIADYVLMTYGTGAIMGVPAHDERDFDFALTYGLPIIPVIERVDGITRAYADFGDVRDPRVFESALASAGVTFTMHDEQFEITLGRRQVDDYVAIARAHVVPGYWLSYCGARIGFVFEDAAIELDSVGADRQIMARVNAQPESLWQRIRRSFGEDPPLTAMETLTGVEFYTAEPNVTFHHDYGTMINSGPLSGTPGPEAVTRTIEWLQARGIGRGEVTYRLRDWLISRQRYWGTPIPIIYCEVDGIVPVPEEDLPVILPTDAEFMPTQDQPGSPLARNAAFMNVQCPVCGRPARRETDTLDTFMDSSWYWYRYLSPHDDERPFDPVLAARWLPVDLYTGGIEHAILHLLYARFFTKAMADMGLISFREPFRRLFNQGIILGENNEKMSKSRGNVVAPDELVAEVGADTVRLFLMFLGPWDQGGPWNSRGITGVRRFLDRAFTIVNETADNPTEQREDPSTGSGQAATRALRRVTHQTIRAVTADFESFSFNTMVAHLMEFVNELMRLKDTEVARTTAWREAVETLALLLAPGAPHIAEELWQRLGNEFSIHTQPWPDWNPELAAEETIEIAVQINGKVRDHITIPAAASEEEVLAAARAARRIAEQLAGKQIVKELYVPGRLVNFVVR